MSETRTESEHVEEDQPRGTLVLLLLFVVLIAAMFGWTYLTLLERS